VHADLVCATLRTIGVALLLLLIALGAHCNSWRRTHFANQLMMHCPSFQFTTSPLITQHANGRPGRKSNPRGNQTA